LVERDGDGEIVLQYIVRGRGGRNMNYTEIAQNLGASSSPFMEAEV